uniref:Secreted protein n=1 Tax=Haemonchus placei TaxID=6290 RepID=A0A0N4WXX3_HAEPC
LLCSRTLVLIVVCYCIHRLAPNHTAPYNYSSSVEWPTETESHPSFLHRNGWDSVRRLGPEFLQYENLFRNNAVFLRVE